MIQLLTSILSSVVAGLGIWQQANDPEVKRLRKLEDIEKRMDVLRERRDQIIGTIDEENKDDSALELGSITNELLHLNKKADTLKR